MSTLRQRQSPLWSILELPWKRVGGVAIVMLEMCTCTVGVGAGLLCCLLAHCVHCTTVTRRRTRGTREARMLIRFPSCVCLDDWIGCVRDDHVIRTYTV